MGYEDTYYMYGKHPVLSALNNSHRRIKQVLCIRSLFDMYSQIICKHHYKIVDTAAINKILKRQCNHQGIIAQTYSIYCSNLARLNFNNQKNYAIAILDRVTDPQNVGAVIRSAAAFNIDAIIMPIDHSPAENATIAKAACGALELVNIVQVTNLRQIIVTLKKQGFWVIGFDGTAAQSLNDYLLPAKVALVFGAEEKGLRRLTGITCDALVKIPISANINSLNIAAAASIAFYHRSMSLF